MSHITEYAQAEDAGYYIPSGRSHPKAMPLPEQQTRRCCLVVFTGMQTRFFDDAELAEDSMTSCQRRGLPYGVFTYDETAGRYWPGINPPQP